MKNPKENTIKYLVAIGAVEDACKVLGWECQKTNYQAVELPTYWIKVPAETGDEAKLMVVAAGFKLTSLDWPDWRPHKSYWWVGIKEN